MIKSQVKPDLLNYVMNWVERVEGTKVKTLVLNKYNAMKPEDEVTIINLVDEVYKEHPEMKPPYYIPETPISMSYKVKE